MGFLRRRRAGSLATALAMTICVAGLASPSGATPGAACADPSRLFAVDADTGVLAELQACSDPAGIVEVAEVDAGDWRGAQHVFAVEDGAVTVVYAVTADGRLEARRQDAPAGPLDPPVQVGASVDWSSFQSVVPSAPGYLVGNGHRARTFRHVDWAAGGTAVVEGPPLFTPLGEWPTLGDLHLTAVRDGGYAEAFFASTHFRVWSQAGGRPIAYPSGAISSGVDAVTGSEPTLYGIRGGAVVQLDQPPHPPPWGTKFYLCPFNTMSWRVTAELPGRWIRVVAPVRGEATGTGPAVGSYPYWPTNTCPQGIGPYEWQ